MAIVDEPVRGSIPPPWFAALSGLERMRALSDGYVARPPLFRLFGIRLGQVAPGATTLTMPATTWAANSYGLLDVHPFMEAALRTAAITALPAGIEIDPLTINLSVVRPNRPHSGNLLARARVVNASRFFAFTEAWIEDANGRTLVHASSQSALRAAEPPPPGPPSRLEPIEEPAYPTPDPPFRPLSARGLLPTMHFGDPVSSPDGWDREAVRRVVGGELRAPVDELTGRWTREMGKEGARVTVPASEWHTTFSRTISPGVLVLLANEAAAMSGIFAAPRGTFGAGLEAHGNFFRGIPANGREISAETVMRFPSPRHGIADVEVRDADGNLAATFRNFAVYDVKLRAKSPRPAAKRMLATLLFTDVVDSTTHADRLGDGRWRELLGEFRGIVRGEIARHEGTEVDTAGDGFFVSFDSPARAIDCARALRDAVRRLGVELRSGIHTGECEIEAGKPTGMAVHIAARIQASASPGEILLSETVKALATGSGLAFEDRGTRELKGVPDPWRLHALAGETGEREGAG